MAAEWMGLSSENITTREFLPLRCSMICLYRAELRSMDSLSDDEAYEIRSITYPVVSCLEPGKVLVSPLQDNRGGRALAATPHTPTLRRAASENDR